MTDLLPVSARVVASRLIKAGFEKVHQRGSHLKLWHPITKRRVTIPVHAGDIPKKTLASIIKQSGLPAEMFFKK